jgi:serine protease AprX
MSARRIGRRAAAVLVSSTLMAAAVSGGTASAGTTSPLGYDPTLAKGSLYNIAGMLGAHAAYDAGITGKGIGVALIDTGVSPVPGLTSGNVVNGPDLSFDSQNPDFAHLDGYGHGTHLASIIAGRDVAGTPKSYVTTKRFNGIAPDATLVNVKVGASDGSVDVTQVIAGIDWVVEHAEDHNIRIINLSYGTDSTQSSLVDPLAFAIENAVKHGIIVVAAGGNDGDSTKTLANPASDAVSLAVGAVDTLGTSVISDDFIPSWSTRGTTERHVDLVAPGVSVLGLRVPHGYADQRNPGAVVGTRFAKASGTSQAAAVVSGGLALLLQYNPKLTPYQAKQNLMSSALDVDGSSLISGSGRPTVKGAMKVQVPATQPDAVWGDGSGSIEAARGSSHVHDGVSPLQGEVDIFGQPWDGAAWASETSNLNAWDGGQWRGVEWTGATWADGAWPATTWVLDDWAAQTWRSEDWSAQTWRDASWTAQTWRDSAWSAQTWRVGDFASHGWV